MNSGSAALPCLLQALAVPTCVSAGISSRVPAVLEGGGETHCSPQRPTWSSSTWAALCPLGAQGGATHCPWWQSAGSEQGAFETTHIQLSGTALLHNLVLVWGA